MCRVPVLPGSSPFGVSCCSITTYAIIVFSLTSAQESIEIVHFHFDSWLLSLSPLVLLCSAEHRSFTPVMGSSRRWLLCPIGSTGSPSGDEHTRLPVGMLVDEVFACLDTCGIMCTFGIVSAICRFGLCWPEEKQWGQLPCNGVRSSAFLHVSCVITTTWLKLRN